MMYGLINNEKKLSYPKAKATCPDCNGVLIAKCGHVNTWHWSHKSKVKDCDYKPETEWHRKWKSYFPKDRCEVHIIKEGRKKIADAVMSNGKVVEFQHSPISVDEIILREKFYGDMIWIFDCRDACIDLRPKKSYHTFRWMHAKRTLYHITKPCYLDLGERGIFRLKKISENAPHGGWGNLDSIQKLISFFKS